MSQLGSEQNPLRVAVVGSGPSGFYATEALIRSEYTVFIDMFERLPVPFGLVRSGVAPDHPKLKEAIFVYEKIAKSPEYSLLANVTVGRDVTVDELRKTHHAIVFTCGAETDRTLGIPGEDLLGSHTATEFVGWYNGHPDYRDQVFDFSHPVAVIVGQGNVAVDVCRILAKTVDELKHTDIGEHALEALAESRIRDVHMVGRRGPAQAKFTHSELKELGELDDCDPVVDPSELELNSESQLELDDKRSRAKRRNLEILEKFASRPASTSVRRCHLHFLKSPVRLVGAEQLAGIVLSQNRLEGEPFQQVARASGETTQLDCGLLFRSIGYRGIPISEVPFDEGRGVFPNEEGRLLDAHGIVSGLYAAGWIKRGPTGIIGTNRADSVATVKSLLSDLPKLNREKKPGAAGLDPQLVDRGVRVFRYGDWQKVDRAEVERGKPKGKPREKFTRVDEILAALD